jgi:glucokinase
MPPSSSDRPLFLGIDFGGSTLRTAVVDASGGILERTRTLLPEDMAARAAAPLELTARYRGVVAGVGMAVAGTVHAGVLTWSANLGLHDIPYERLLTEASGVPAVLLNDARAAGLAEARWGAGAGRDLALVLTVGTGIGGALVHGGQLVEGTGNAGEVGHMRLADCGVRCGCGREGCWETFAGGRALERQARALLGESVADAASQLAERAQAGDPAAAGVVAAAARYFSRGVDVLCAVLAPDIIVLGGGVMARRGYVADTYHAALSSLRWGTGTRIVHSALGDDAGKLGAAARAMAPQKRPEASPSA